MLILKWNFNMREILPYGRHSITEEDISAVTQTLRSSYLTQGPKVKEFEEKFASYVGSNYAVAVSNGTAALHLCAMVMNVNSDSTVITSPITFAASANCIRYCNGTVDLCDIEKDTGVIDIEELRKKLAAAPEGKYDGLVIVDFAGYPADMEAFRGLADEYGLWIIEDSCHAVGAWFFDQNGTKQKSGNGHFADLAIFSFHPVKHIACGEGGIITTNDKALYQRLLKLRTHGITKDATQFSQANEGGWYYEMQELGYNYRMPDILCALGISQLDRAEKGIARRQEIARMYDKAFSANDIKVLGDSENKGHAYHLYIILIPNRKELYKLLQEQNIYTQVHYIPLHHLPYYKTLLPGDLNLPNADSYYEQCLSLPMYPTLTDEDVQYVITAVLSLA